MNLYTPQEIDDLLLRWFTSGAVGAYFRQYPEAMAMLKGPAQAKLAAIPLDMRRQLVSGLFVAITARSSGNLVPDDDALVESLLDAMQP